MCGSSDLFDGEPAAPLIVVLDPDEALREALRFSLETEGYRVRAFGASQDLLACAPRAACYVIDEAGCDPSLGAMLGRQRAPVILLSGRPERVRAGSRATIIDKPLVTDALSQQIAAVLQSHKHHFPGEGRGPDPA